MLAAFAMILEWHSCSTSGIGQYQRDIIMTEGLRFEGVSITVEDVERALGFYRDKLNFEVLYSSPAFALVNTGTGTLGLLSLSQATKRGAVLASPEQRRGIHIEFSTDDLDGLYATLLANGVEFTSPPHDEPWERAMSAADPDGYTVEFAQGRRGSAAMFQKR